MALLSSIKVVNQLKKLLGSGQFLNFLGDAGSQACLSYVSYKAHRSMYEYYKGFDNCVSYDEFVMLVRASEAVRNVLKDAINNKISPPKDTEIFDFKKHIDEETFITSLGIENASLSKLYSDSTEKALIPVLMLRIQIKYYCYANQVLGYKYSWDEFSKRLLSDAEFLEPCRSELFNYIMRIDFTESWHDKNVIGLLNAAKKNIHL